MLLGQGRGATLGGSDVLKIDRSFVAGIDVGPEDPVLVRAIVRLGQTLGLSIVAQVGVTTLVQSWWPPSPGWIDGFRKHALG